MSGLLQFSERPNAGDSKRSYPILRCDAEQKYRLSGFILSTRIYGVNVHYVGKSVPCSAPKEACTWCDSGRPLRWVGYAPACDLDRQNLFLFEFTPGVMPTFERFLQMHDGLRGSYVNLTRRKPRPNSRLEASIQPAGKYLPPGDLPAAFNVEEVLERIYGLTTPDETSGPDPVATPALANEVRKPAAERAAAASGSPLKSDARSLETLEDEEIISEFSGVKS